MDYLNDINLILSVLLINNGSTIKYIEEKTSIPTDRIFAILMSMKSTTFECITLDYDNYRKDIEITATSKSMFCSTARWFIDMKGLKKIPVNNLNYIEKVILNAFSLGIFDLSVSTYASEKQFIIKKKSPVKTLDLMKEKHFKAIRDSIIEKKCVDVIYRDGMAKEYRMVLMPIGITCDCYSGIWYLIAQNHQNKIFPYRINRFFQYRITEITFKDHKDICLEEYVENLWGLEVGNEGFVEVVFYNDGNVVKKAMHRLRGKGQIKINSQSGDMTFCGTIKGMKNFTAWLRTFGSSTKVISPSALRNEMVESAKKVLNNYYKIDQKNFY